MFYLKSSATICGEYRYALDRTWDIDLPLICWIMLNPSTADGQSDDNTIRKCVTFSNRWNYGGLVVVNLFALRATDPKALYLHDDPIGPEGNDYILRWAKYRRVKEVMAAWGVHGQLNGRGDQVRAMLAGAGVSVKCLRKTSAGQPWHPLYLPAALTPIPF